jgi:predicted small secreted protein
MMKTFVKALLIPLLIPLPFVLTCCTTMGGSGTQAGGSPPVITNSFASKELSPGDIWKIYVEAHDPDGDMRQFVCVIKQVGYGEYSADYVVIKEPHREKMKGYLRFFSGAGGGSRLGEWTNLSLTLYIRDRGRKNSNKVVFPLTLSRGSKQAPPPPPFNTGGLDRLGTIATELKDPLGGYSF